MDERQELDADEARLLGVLIEKELGTPDQYPLSLNALAAGCNQRSNRDPVLSLGESQVRAALDRLRLVQLVGGVQQSGSRIERYRHNAREALRLEPPELAVLAELLLRGAQAPGELRARVSRMVPLETLEELERSLELLMGRGLVARLAPAPGSRAPRYDQLLARRERDEAPTRPPSPAAGGPAEPVRAESRPPAGGGPANEAAPLSSRDLAARVGALEASVRKLQGELEALAREVAPRREHGAD